MTADIYQPNPDMRFGLVLPSIGYGTSPASLEAAATACVRHGWTSVWVTDHVLVPQGPEAGEYGSILEAMTALTWVAARFDGLKVGTSVIVPAMRDAPLLAKQLATLDTLTGGRLIVGVGASDSRDDIEYANLGKSDRFARRGAYLDEAVALWRHLWAGRTDPFAGEFHTLSGFCFAPLPPQGPASRSGAAGAASAPCAARPSSPTGITPRRPGQSSCGSGCRRSSRRPPRRAGRCPRCRSAPGSSSTPLPARSTRSAAATRR